MAWLSDEQLVAAGFAKIGRNVKISDRASIYDVGLMELGDNSRIDDFCVISGKVVLGRNVHIAVFCNVAGGSEGVFFDDFSGLAYGCHVFSQSDDYTGRSLTNPTVPDRFKLERKEKVVIGRHCIAGTASLIFPGVVMAEGCSLGAMSMLTKSTEPWSMYFGVPAKRVKSRRREMLQMEAEYLDLEKKVT